MLKQMTPEKRDLFLSLFTQELIQQSIPQIEIQEVKKEIKEEIVKPTIIKKEKVVPPQNPRMPAPPPYEITSKITLDSTKTIPVQPKPIKTNYPRIQPPIPQTISPLTKPPIMPQKPALRTLSKAPMKAPLTQLPSLAQIRQPIQPIKEKRTIRISSPIIQKRSPTPQAIKTGTGEIDLGKLNVFLHDKGITTMECPGPEKFILIKRLGKINLTRIKLSKEEIDKIIKNFSERARIPLLGGVFKAVIGDLSISAVTSELVGSRFIIYRKTPYSIVEQGLR